MESTQRSIVIGASAGGIEALQDVVAQLPADLPAPVCVVLHLAPYRPSALAEILTKAGPLPAMFPSDGTPLKPGMIYVAPPDHHLLMEHDALVVTKGPKENRFRPSIDALFRSAAYAYGPRAIGVVLSGALDDGTSGLWSIKRLGGIAIVQEPSQAQIDGMPQSVLEYVEVDHVLPSTAIGAVLGCLSQEPSEPGGMADAVLTTRMATEVQIALGNSAFEEGIMELGTPTPFACPECHGVLLHLSEGLLSRFRCHTGHAYSDSALLAAVMEGTGEMMWQVIRSFEEAVMLLRHMGQHRQAAGALAQAEAFFEKARELEQRSLLFRRTVLHHESLSGDNLGRLPEEGL